MSKFSNSIRYKDHEYMEQNKKWKDKNQDKVKEYRDQWKQENASIEKFHSTVYRARNKGVLIPTECCLLCKKIKPLQAHHSDYSKPLDVMWLCHSCHQLIHHYKDCPSLEGMIPQKKVEVIGSTING